MKILKIFGAVIGAHFLFIVLFFAIPGCSSTTKPAPAPIDTVTRSESAAAVTLPGASAAVALPPADASPVTAAPINFNPDAPAYAAPAGGNVRYTPTRPYTAAASTLVAEPVTDITPATTYTVKSGDSLWSIASKNHLTYQDLATANNLKTTAALHAGQKLIIPGKKPAAPAAATTASATAAAKPAADAAKSAPADAVKYTVKSGDSLSTIAKAFDMKQGDIAVANNITDPAKIRAGMVLVIPGGGWQKPGGKAGKPAAKTAAAPSNAKPAPEPAKPLFSVPGSDSDSPVKAAPSPTATPKEDVPVIKVDDTPAPKKP